MPRLGKKKANKCELHLPDPTFPWCIGDIVEMKTQEIGYRGAWFRVEIKSVRRGKYGKLYSTVIYKDYPDESEEEIVAIDFDPLTKKNTLMIRPLPPPAMKESAYDETEQLNTMHLVYREYWETGDMVEWWYHDCWWFAEVISVLGDGRFQLKCPSPPHGEGGVYMAKGSDLRASLNWSQNEQWTVPPSKVPGMKQCARLVGPVLCQHVIPVRFLDPGTEEPIEDHEEISGNEYKIQMTRKELSKYDRCKKKDFNGSMIKPKSKSKLQLKAQEQSEAKPHKSFKNLENQPEDEEQETLNREIHSMKSSVESLSQEDPIEHSYISEEGTCEKQKAPGAIQDKHSFNDKIMVEQLTMAKVLGLSGLQLVGTEVGPESRNDPGKTTLKHKRPRGRPPKTSNRDVTSGQPVHQGSIKTLQAHSKKVSKPQVEQKVGRDEMLEDWRDEIPTQGSKSGSKANSGHTTALSGETNNKQGADAGCKQGGDGQQAKRRQKISSGKIDVGLQRAYPEMRVLFDVGIENVQRSFKDEKKRKRLVEDVTEEASCVHHRGRGHPRKVIEISRHLEQEERSLTSGDIQNEGKYGKKKGAVKELDQSPIKNKKRRFDMKVAKELQSEVLSTSSKEVVGEATIPIYAPASPKGVQRENQKVHIRVTETWARQSESPQVHPQRVEQRHVESEKRTAMELTKKLEVLNEISGAKITSGQDLKVTVEESESHGLSTSVHRKLQAPSSISMPGIITDNEDGLVQKEELIIKDGLNKFPDRYLGRSACTSNYVRDAVLEWDLEGTSKPVSSNEVPISAGCSIGSRSEGICLSSGVVRENDLNDDTISAIGLEADADSCSVKFGCARARPLEDCVQDPSLSRVLVVKPSRPHRSVDSSSLRRLIDKPVITYKNCLSRKLVSRARRELWSKEMSLSKRRIF